MIEAKCTVVQVIVPTAAHAAAGGRDAGPQDRGSGGGPFFHFPVAAGSREALARRLLAALGSQRERALFSISLRTATSGLPAAPIVG